MFISCTSKPLDYQNGFGNEFSLLGFWRAPCGVTFVPFTD